MNFIIKILFIVTNFININALKSNQLSKISRRSIVCGSLLMPTITNANILTEEHTIFQLSPTFNNIENNKDDPFAYWSVYGLVPPPIEKIISYDDLLENIKNRTILSLQIAVQHDCVIATTKEGHRWACLVKDKNFPQLLMDVMDKNGNMPVYVLPEDPVRSKIRNVAQTIFYSSALFYILSDLDIIPYQFEAYNSIKEREDALRSGKKPKKFLKSLVDKILNNTNITNITEYD
jgi:ATP-dependent Zn protease